MSIEFVGPEPRAPTPVPAPPTGSALPGRLLGAAAAAAGVVALVGVNLTLYAVVRTASIVDFDGTTYRVSRIPVDAFGTSTPVRLTSADGLALSDLTSTVSVPDGVSYGPWWLGLGVALLVAGVWALLRPRSTPPVAFVAALGGLLLGSLGAAWLAARAVVGTSVPQIRLVAAPAPGLWFLLAGGALALLAALARVVAPHVHRRRTDVHDPGPATA